MVGLVMEFLTENVIVQWNKKLFQSLTRLKVEKIAIRKFKL